MAMDEFLAGVFGTAKTAAAATPSKEEALEKEATVQLFLKLAGEQKIDISSMPDADVAALYADFETRFKQANAPAKTAAEDEDAKKKELREKAEKEHEEKKAAAEKIAEAQALGRVMAHAYVDELKKIAADNKVAEIPEALRKGMEAHRAGKPEEGKPEHKEEKKEHEEKKEGAAQGVTALDSLAAARAVELAKTAGLDPAVASQKITALFTLGMHGDGGEKVAAAANVAEATDIRALQLLEKAGYPVNWT